MRSQFWFTLGLALFPLAGLAESPADFSGEWVLIGNSSKDSDHSSTPSPQHPSGHSGMGGHGGHGGGGGGGGHHGQSGQSAPSNAEPVGAPSMSLRVDAHELIIRQSDVVFDIAANGKRTAYRFDNHNNYGSAYGGTVQLTWSAPEMVIETHPDAGGSIEEHYTLTPDGKKLTLLTRVQDPGNDNVRETRHEFERDDGSAASDSTNPSTLPP
jgi:hypothetical protein